jgi:hypothetical protein
VEDGGERARDQAGHDRRREHGPEGTHGTQWQGKPATWRASWTAS